MRKKSVWRAPARVMLAHLVVVSVAVFVVSKAEAHHTPGVGTVTSAPLLFASSISSGERSYLFVAHHTPSADATHIYAYESGLELGPAPHDEVFVGPEALQIEWDSTRSLWNVYLEVDLPTLGRMNLRLVSSQGFDRNGVAYTPEFEWYSPSRGLSSAGHILGSVAGDSVSAYHAVAWGSDVYGYYALFPMGYSI